MQEFILQEKNENQLERAMELIDAQKNVIKTFYVINKPNKFERDIHKTIPSMINWGWLPTQDYQVTIKYMDGQQNVVNG